jgi:aspartate racemase
LCRRAAPAGGVPGFGPAAGGQDDRIIYDELCLGVIKGESRQIYRSVIERLAAAGAQGIVLGCTEIELLVSEADSPVPVFATTRLHVEAAVDASLAGLTLPDPA